MCNTNYELDALHFFSDAYVEVEASYCLRSPEPLQGNMTNVLIYNIQNAKVECSKNSRCIGIESIKLAPPARVAGITYPFPLCLDAIYTGSKPAKYETPAILAISVIKKEENQGTCTSQEETY